MKQARLMKRVCRKNVICGKCYVSISIPMSVAPDGRINWGSFEMLSGETNKSDPIHFEPGARRHIVELTELANNAVLSGRKESK